MSLSEILNAFALGGKMSVENVVIEKVAIGKKSWHRCRRQAESYLFLFLSKQYILHVTAYCPICLKNKLIPRWR